MFVNKKISLRADFFAQRHKIMADKIFKIFGMSI